MQSLYSLWYVNPVVHKSDLCILGCWGKTKNPLSKERGSLSTLRYSTFAGYKHYSTTYFDSVCESVGRFLIR